MEEADPLPDGLVVAGAARSRRGWALREAGVPPVVEVRSAEGGTVAPTGSIGALDVAEDGLVAACGDDGSLVVAEAGAVTRTAPASIGADGLACRDVVAGGGEVWAVLGTNVRADRLCLRRDATWSCTELERPVASRTLALTAGHVWWLVRGEGVLPSQVIALPRSGAPELRIVREGILLSEGTLTGSAIAEQVLFVPLRSQTDQSPAWIALDGARTTLVAASEEGAYVDVWPTTDGRTLALDVIVGATQRCSAGYLGYGGGCSWTIHWTQLVVSELSTDEPVEIAHVDYPGGGHGQLTIGMERTDETWVSGDRWYRVP